MMIPKRRLLTLIFACLCFKKSLICKLNWIFSCYCCACKNSWVTLKKFVEVQLYFVTSLQNKLLIRINLHNYFVLALWGNVRFLALRGRKRFISLNEKVRKRVVIKKVTNACFFMVGRYGRRGRRARRKYYLLAIFRTGLISDYSRLKEVQCLWHLISMDARLIHAFFSRLMPIFCHHPFHIHFLNFCSYSQAVDEEDVEDDDEGVSYSFTSVLHFLGPRHMSPFPEISPCL